MSIKTVLFDLDGTLLPMDHESFGRLYFGTISRYFAPHGYDPRMLVEAINEGIIAMVMNDGSVTNEQACWNVLRKRMGERIDSDIGVFEKYYATEFEKTKPACGLSPYSASLIGGLKSAGYRIVLATNPMFPATATEQRIKWAGLSPDDFELYTTYEDFHYTKPSLNYYREIIEKLSLEPTECLMVGNDVGEDMIAERLGMKVFLVTDCLINKKNADVSSYPQGALSDLAAAVEKGENIDKIFC